jgi:DNA-binding CsgD family transcriptional regulator
MNAGLISAVGYPYRSALVDRARLDELGQEAVLEACVTFDVRGAKGFTDHAVPIIDRTIRKEFPGSAHRRFLTDKVEPMIQIYRFMASIEPVAKGDPRPEEPLLSEVEERELILRNVQFLQYINLPNDEFSARTGADVSTLYKWMNKLCRQLRLSSRQELALAALEAGVQIDTPPLPEDLQLTDRQRLIASLAYMPYDQVAEKLDTTFSAVNHATKIVKSKLGARSRTEVVIMMRKYDLGPIEYEGPEYMRDFTELERSVVPYLHLENNELISELTGLSIHSVAHAIDRMMERTGTARRRQLAVWLQEKGYVFGVVKPPRPLREIVKADRLDIWKNAHLTDDELAERSGVDVDQLRYLLGRGKALTGARSRTELALVARFYSRGKFEEAEGYKTKAE